MAKYGFSYQGGKNSLADGIISALPPGEYLYDLFAGGCAITHAALLSGKWGAVYSNDIQNTPRLFLDAVSGKYKTEKRWISREQFHAEKERDSYIRWVWSFGNNGAGYMFGRDIEPIKKAAHEYVFSHGYDGTAKKRIELLAKFKQNAGIKKRFDLQQLEQLERLQRLEQLQRLQRLQRLESLSSVLVSAIDYRKVKINPGAIVYCDPPYSHKKGLPDKYYGIDFDTIAFYAWVRANKNPVFFSSVDAPSDFNLVWEKGYSSRMNNVGSAGKKKIVEKLFWNGVK